MTALDFGIELGLEQHLRDRLNDLQILQLELCTVRWNGRFKRRLGTAHCHDRPEDRIIELNPALRAHSEQLVDTYLHECAHVLVPEDPGHGVLWQEMAQLLGAAPRAVRRGAPIVQRKLVAVCAKCSKEIRRHKALPRSRVWLHKGCGGQLRRVC